MKKKFEDINWVDPVKAREVYEASRDEAAASIRKSRREGPMIQLTVEEQMVRITQCRCSYFLEELELGI